MTIWGQDGKKTYKTVISELNTGVFAEAFQNKD